MAVKIEKKIVAYAVKTDDNSPAESIAGSANQPALDSPEIIKQPDKKKAAVIVRMHEKVERPDRLIGNTYKIKTPISEHAFYITINDMILNPGTPYEKRRPFEVFINSKNMDHYQWISALTLIISAVFRKGGDVTFLVRELRSVFDPKGGYFKKGGRYMPSLVAEIGDAIETHMKIIGLIKENKVDPHQQQLIDEKRKEFEASTAEKPATEPDEDKASFPPGATLCNKCSTKAMIMMDGCLTCLNCGESKCG